MRLLFPFALYLVAFAQQNPDPWDQSQVNRYRDSACAEVRGLKDADCRNLPEVKPVPHKPTYNELLLENGRLKTDLAAAQEATKEAQTQMGVYFEEIQRLKARHE